MINKKCIWCSNKYCTWCSFGLCCHEDSKEMEKATPHQLDCPLCLRRDFENEFFNCTFRTKNLLNKQNFKNMRKIEKYINNLEGDR